MSGTISGPPTVRAEREGTLALHQQMVVETSALRDLDTDDRNRASNERGATAELPCIMRHRYANIHIDGINVYRVFPMNKIQYCIVENLSSMLDIPVVDERLFPRRKNGKTGNQIATNP